MLTKSGLYNLWKNDIATPIKRRRVEYMLRLLKLPKKQKLKILEIGCSNCKDVIRFLNSESRYELYGVDIVDSNHKQDNFTFVKCDAEELPFESKFFDAVISVGTLAHIDSMEKLSKITKECERVGKSYIMVVPSLMTPLEPHAVRPFWPLMYHRNMISKHTKSKLKLNFFSDHTWSKFEGFKDADIRRYWYIPFLILDTVIYKKYIN